MIKSDYWDLTTNPHTEVKLSILSKYLPAWADILFGQYRKNVTWVSWRTLYYVDCFAGRGKYHKNGKQDCVDGSPILALKTAVAKQQHIKEKFNLDVEIKCRFIEHKSKSVQELKSFCSEYDGKVDYKILDGNFSDLIHDVVVETGNSPAFFFVDPAGIREMRKQSVDKIIRKKGARDIMLNYIVDGPRRVGGLDRSIREGTYKGKDIVKHMKVIKTLEDFSGMPVNDFIKETDKETLIQYVRSVFESNNSLRKESDRLETIAYNMPHPDRNDTIYYLLFSSRKGVAMKIMKNIFSDSKKHDLTGTISLFDPSDEDFNLGPH